MCLDYVTYEPWTEEKKIGYKLFVPNKDGTKFSGLFYNVSKKYELNEIYIDEKDHFIYSDTRSYKTGFHIFKTEQDARSYGGISGKVLVKVEYSNVVAEGYQNGWYGKCHCVVAKQMKLVEIVYDYYKEKEKCV